MEYRFLSERLRSAFFLTICGVEISPYRRVSEKDIWIYPVFEENWGFLPKKRCIDDYQLLDKYIKEAWVEEQIKHHKKVEKYEKKSSRFESAKEKIFKLAIFSPLFHLIIHHVFLAKFLTLLALILPPLAATIEAIHGFMEYNHLIKHHKQMVSDLERIKKIPSLYYSL